MGRKNTRNRAFVSRGGAQNAEISCADTEGAKIPEIDRLLSGKVLGKHFPAVEPGECLLFVNVLS